MVEVFYNGINPFKLYGAPTPFVGVTDDFVNYGGNRWGAVKNITLDGMITGINFCSGNLTTYSDLVKKQSGIYDAFSKDFKNLEIKENNITVYSGEYIKVNSVDFDSSNYFRTVNFKIGLTSYPQNLFTGTYGVMSPTSTIKYSEQMDGIVNVTRSFSAKGVNTSNSTNNALDNARNYVRSITGVDNIILPSFISGVKNYFPNNINPRKIGETINRLDSSYSLNIDYSIRKYANSLSVLSYDVDISYDEERGLYNVTFKGSLAGGMSQSISDLRNDFNNFSNNGNNIYSLTSSVFLKVINDSSKVLNPNVDSFSVTENEQNNVIDFSYSYTTDPRNVKFDYTIDLQNEYLTDKVSVNFNGILTARGPQSYRTAQLEQYLTQVNVPVLCQQYYNSGVSTSALPMNTIYRNYNVKRNISNNSTSFNIQASFDNTQSPPKEFKSFTWSIAITPSIKQYTPIQYLNGTNGIFDLNFFKRGKISIQGTAVAKDASSTDYSTQVRSYALSYLNQYASQFAVRNRVEDKIEKNLLSDENGYVYNFNITDTCETPIFQYT